MTKSPSQANADLKGRRFKKALVGSVLSKRSIEEQRRFVDYFVQGIRVDGREGWLEAAFYEDPSLPGTSFCMVPPTGFEPSGVLHALIDRFELCAA